MNGSNFDGSGSNTATPNFFTSYLPGFNPYGGNSALLFLDDGGGGADDNHDDLIVRLDYVPAPIPVPAGGLLLFGGSARHAEEFGSVIGESPVRTGQHDFFFRCRLHPSDHVRIDGEGL